MDPYAEDRKPRSAVPFESGELFVGLQNGEDFVVLADPDGNVFCFVQV